MSISSVNFEGRQQSQSGNRVLRHALNTAAIVGNTAMVGSLLAVGAARASSVCSNRIALSNGSKVVKTNVSPIYRFCEKIGNKLFSDKTVIGQSIKRFVTGELPSGGHLADPKQIAAYVTKYKTIGAMGLLAGVALLPAIAISIYNAGKINAEK